MIPQGLHPMRTDLPASTATPHGAAAPHHHPDALLNEDDTARFLAVSCRTLQRWRLEGGGPAFIRMGERRVAYRYADLTAWTNARRFTSTAEESAQAAKGVAP